MEAPDNDSFVPVVSQHLSKCHTWQISSRLVELLTCKKTKVPAYSACGLFSTEADSCIGDVIALITGLAYLVEAWAVELWCDFKIQIRGIPVEGEV